MKADFEFPENATKRTFDLIEIMEAKLKIFKPKPAPKKVPVTVKQPIKIARKQPATPSKPDLVERLVQKPANAPQTSAECLSKLNEKTEMLKRTLKPVGPNVSQPPDDSAAKTSSPSSSAGPKKRLRQEAASPDTSMETRSASVKGQKGKLKSGTTNASKAAEGAQPPGELASKTPSSSSTKRPEKRARRSLLVQEAASSSVEAPIVVEVLPKIPIEADSASAEGLASKTPSPSNSADPKKRRSVEAGTAAKPSEVDAQKLPAMKPTQVVEKAESLPVPPRVDQTNHLQAVQNIGFIIDGGRVKLKCVSGDCPFVLMPEELFIDHLKDAHEDLIWNRFCNICAEMVDFERGTSIIDEWQHMKDAHLKDVQDEPHPVLLTFAASSSKPEEVTSDPPLIKLRPWLSEAGGEKPDVVARMMQHQSCLAAFFKCMDKSCAFFTSKTKIFADHLKLHNTTATAHRQCAYCRFTAGTDMALVKHLMTVHEHDKFQCNFCFYRSAAAANVYNHTLYHHREEKVVVIEILHVKSKPYDGVVRSVNDPATYAALVVPVKCLFCDETFYQLDGFKQHLEQHEQFGTSSTSKCSACDETIKTNSLFKHLEKKHKIGAFQCAFCHCGTDSSTLLKVHVADMHQSQIPVYWKRQGNGTVRLEPIRFEKILNLFFFSFADRCSGSTTDFIQISREGTFPHQNEPAVGSAGERRQRGENRLLVALTCAHRFTFTTRLEVFLLSRTNQTESAQMF